MKKVHPAPLHCLCDGVYFASVFTYNQPPEGETCFQFSAADCYRREVMRCHLCGHFVSLHAMDASRLYAGDYVSSAYGDNGIQQAFARIIALAPARSDNTGRVQRILTFAATYLPAGPSRGGAPTVLDVGAGLGVFLYRMKAAGWECTALDPDIRAVVHARETVGVTAVCGDFMAVQGLGRFDVVTFNKVLEHVKDPVALLAQSLAYLQPEGFVYVEVPDGEAAVVDGPEREEFFIDHWHVFSAVSLAQLAARAGFTVCLLERLREPSSKYTLRAFLVPTRSAMTPD